MFHVVEVPLKDDWVMIGKTWYSAKHFAFTTGRMFLFDATVETRGLQNRFPSLDISKPSGTSINSKYSGTEDVEQVCKPNSERWGEGVESIELIKHGRPLGLLGCSQIIVQMQQLVFTC